MKGSSRKHSYTTILLTSTVSCGVGWQRWRGGRLRTFCQPNGMRSHPHIRSTARGCVGYTANSAECCTVKTYKPPNSSVPLSQQRERWVLNKQGVSGVTWFHTRALKCTSGYAARGGKGLTRELNTYEVCSTQGPSYVTTFIFNVA